MAETKNRVTEMMDMQYAELRLAVKKTEDLINSKSNILDLREMLDEIESVGDMYDTMVQIMATAGLSWTRDENGIHTIDLKG